MITEEQIARAVDALALEITKRNEWYGLDNWDLDEVVWFVVDHLGLEEIDE